jgi:hypothetical protein
LAAQYRDDMLYEIKGKRHHPAMNETSIENSYGKIWYDVMLPHVATYLVPQQWRRDAYISEGMI